MTNINSSSRVSLFISHISYFKNQQFQQITDTANIVFHEVYDEYTPQDHVNDFVEYIHQSPSAIEEHNFHYFLVKSKKK